MLILLGVKGLKPLLILLENKTLHFLNIKGHLLLFPDEIFMYCSRDL